VDSGAISSTEWPYFAINYLPLFVLGFLSLLVACQFYMAVADSGGLVMRRIRNNFLWASGARFSGI
jgi:hypothetical protein